MTSFIDFIGVLRGLQKINRAAICLRQRELDTMWKNSSLRPVVRSGITRLEEITSTCLVAEKPISCNTGNEYTTANSSATQSSILSTVSNPSSLSSPSVRSFHTSAAVGLYASIRRSKDSIAAGDVPLITPVVRTSAKVTQGTSSTRSSDDSGSSKPLKKVKKVELSKRSKERRVPGSQVERLVSFGSLGAGLAIGALAEAAKRSFGLSNTPNAKNGILDNSIILTEANANRIVETLCKVRGAALKLGQMISIQDNSFVNPQLQRMFERVRQSADFMPAWQMEKVLVKDLGTNWRDKFKSFESMPFAAASIGQVHKATMLDGRQVAVKIQYPGVAESINSDINNLVALLKVWQILPPDFASLAFSHESHVMHAENSCGSVVFMNDGNILSLYADQALKVARRELSWECDYIREAKSADRFRNLLKDDPAFYVPEVVWDLTTKNVLTTELVFGDSLDKCETSDQELRNWVCENMLRLCLSEVFKFNFMQTDPNWSNFMYDSDNRRIVLIDFGSSREYSKQFTDTYVQIIKSASINDRQGVLDGSVKLGFLSGYETQVMRDAHVDAVMILGEAFANDEVFNFGLQSTAARIHRLIPVMLKNRLSPPPEETYSLHRKMAGCFLLCTKLGAQINCKPMFDNIYKEYQLQQSPDSSPSTSV